jgi:hypothetical protein
VVWLLLAVVVAAAAGGEEPPLRTVEVRGSSAFQPVEVTRLLRLEPGQGLRRSPATLSALLETHFRIAGYPAALVVGRFDAASGELVFEVDEGRLAGVRVEGRDEAASRRLAARAGLAVGQALRQAGLDEGFRRILDETEGALEAGEPPWLLERGPDGVVAVLRLRHRRLGVGLGPAFSPIGRWYTRVEGFSPGARAGLVVRDPSGFNHLTAYATASYGLSAEKVRWAAGARRPFLGDRRLTIGYEFHDLADTDDAFRERGVAGWAGAPLNFSSVADFFGRRGHEAYAFARPAETVQFGLSYRQDRYQSLPLATDDAPFGSGAEDTRPNPPVDEGRMRSLVLAARFSGGAALFASTARERDSFLLRDLYGTAREAEEPWRFDASLEVADAGWLGGDFTFRRFISNLRGHAHAGSRLSFDGRAVLGLSGQESPVQKLFALGGLGSLRGYRAREFPGANMALVQGEMACDAGPLGLVAFAEVGKTWSRGGVSPGWKTDLGLGLTLPAAERPFLRLDLAFPLSEDDRGGRLTGGIFLAF